MERQTAREKLMAALREADYESIEELERTVFNMACLMVDKLANESISKFEKGGDISEFEAYNHYSSLKQAITLLANYNRHN